MFLMNQGCFLTSESLIRLMGSGYSNLLIRSFTSSESYGENLYLAFWIDLNSAEADSSSNGKDAESSA